MRYFFTALTSCGAVEVMRHSDLHLIALDDNIYRIDVLFGVCFHQFGHIHIDDLIRYVFSFDIHFHTINSFNYSNSCFISYKYIVAENRCNYQLQFDCFHISLLTVNSFLDNNNVTL